MIHPAFVVKICGITNEEDARVAIDAGANALGFNFYVRSPRYVTPPRAREIIAASPGQYLKVGIFVRGSVRQLLEAGAEASLDVLQLHGHSTALPRSTAYRIWRALPAGTAPLPAGPPYLPAIEAYLLDSPACNYGGSGETFDWTLAARFPERAIIAGGLEATNVAEAIRIASPWGVDACSRLELSPGRKDPQRVREFVHAALAAIQQELHL